MLTDTRWDITLTCLSAHANAHTYTLSLFLVLKVKCVYMLVCVCTFAWICIWVNGSEKSALMHVCVFQQVLLCDSWRFELSKSLLPLDPNSIRADVTLDSWHSMLSRSLSLCWLSEWQLREKGGNELRAKKVRHIKIRLDVTIGVGTLFSLQQHWLTVFLDTEFARSVSLWMDIRYFYIY